MSYLNRRTLLFLLDALLGLISMYLAFSLRFGGEIPESFLVHFITLLPIVLICRSVSYFYFGFYSICWEYASLDDLINIIKAVVVGEFLILFAIFIYNRAILIPRSIMTIDAVLLVMFLGGARLGWRIFRERAKFKSTSNSATIPVLIYGAGDFGANLLKYLQSFPKSTYEVMGFIDDDPGKQSIAINKIKVLGKRNAIPGLAQQLHIKEILGANNISGEELSKIQQLCLESGAKYKMVSAITNLNTKEQHISNIRNLEISDLLNRAEVFLDLSSINHLLSNKRVLVTGAGGSIGTELCCQLLRYDLSDLIMIDKGENYLSDLSARLSTISSKARKYFLFNSITDRPNLEKIFSKYKPQIIFHVAAYKHVPLMEINIDQAITNNVFGTKLTADLSDQYGVEKFVLVSTDKAVNPENVMGMTKNIAESYIRFINVKSKTQYMAVRFGNVLGSNGSVIPLFQKQIESGGPVLITHPDISRYFMLISEAAQLILQAASLGGEQGVLLLEMGSPIKIIDLAKKMIRLAGYLPDEEMEIEIIGLREGEKIKEELTEADEVLVPTGHLKIKSVKSQRLIGCDFGSKVDELCGFALNPDYSSKDLRLMLAQLCELKKIAPAGRNI